MLAWKLFRVRKDGSIGPLFFDAKLRIPKAEWIEARHDLRKKGFAHRPGWHVTEKPFAPHLSMKGRAWFLVEVEDYTVFERPESQGGRWFIAERIRVLAQKPPEVTADQFEYWVSLALKLESYGAMC